MRQEELLNELDENTSLNRIQDYIKQVIELRGFANQLNINLFEALTEKERKNCKRNWSFER